MAKGDLDDLVQRLERNCLMNQCCIFVIDLELMVDNDVLTN